MKVVDLLRALECMRDVLNSHPDLKALYAVVSIFSEQVTELKSVIGDNPSETLTLYDLFAQDDKTPKKY